MLNTLVEEIDENKCIDNYAYITINIVHSGWYNDLRLLTDRNLYHISKNILHHDDGLIWKQEDNKMHFVTRTFPGKYPRITTAQPYKQQGIDCLNKGTLQDNEDCTLILTVHWWALCELCQGLNNSDRSLALSELYGSWTRLQKWDLCIYCFFNFFYLMLWETRLNNLELFLY